MMDITGLRELRTWLEAVMSDVRTAIVKIDAALAQQPEPLPRVAFSCPLGGVMKPSGDWPEGIFSATDYAEYYTASGAPAYHPGCDLNHVNVAADVKAAVYATADGQIMFVGKVAAWQGQIVIERVLLEDGSYLWVRYAHVEPLVKVGDIVNRGDKIATLTDYTPIGQASGDHLHFDIARIDLGNKPGDWPGNDQARVRRDYLNPQDILKERA